MGRGPCHWGNCCHCILSTISAVTEDTTAPGDATIDVTSPVVHVLYVLLFWQTTGAYHIILCQESDGLPDST
jgi:hypothetical protein